MGFICVHSGIKVRAALTTAIVRKAIGLGHISADNASKVVSFMANDINKVYDGMQVLFRTQSLLVRACMRGGLLCNLCVRFWVTTGRPLAAKQRCMRSASAIRGLAALAALGNSTQWCSVGAGVPLLVGLAHRGFDYYRAAGFTCQAMGPAGAWHRRLHPLHSVLLRLADCREQGEVREARQSAVRCSNHMAACLDVWLPIVLPSAAALPSCDAACGTTRHIAMAAALR